MVTEYTLPLEYFIGRELERMGKPFGPRKYLTREEAMRSAFPDDVLSSDELMIEVKNHAEWRERLGFSRLAENEVKEICLDKNYPAREMLITRKVEFDSSVISYGVAWVMKDFKTLNRPGDWIEAVNSYLADGRYQNECLGLHDGSTGEIVTKGIFGVMGPRKRRRGVLRFAGADPNFLSAMAEFEGKEASVEEVAKRFGEYLEGLSV